MRHLVARMLSTFEGAGAKFKKEYQIKDKYIQCFKIYEHVNYKMVNN